MSVHQTTENPSAALPSIDVLESVFDLLDDPGSCTFFALLDPYQGRSRDIPLATFVKLSRSGAKLDLLERMCDFLVPMTGPGGSIENGSAHFDMLELQYVLRTLKQIRLRLVQVNAPGAAA